MAKPKENKIIAEPTEPIKESTETAQNTVNADNAQNTDNAQSADNTDNKPKRKRVKVTQTNENEFVVHTGIDTSKSVLSWGDLEDIATLDKEEFDSFLSKLSKEQLEQIRDLKDTVFKAAAKFSKIWYIETEMGTIFRDHFENTTILKQAVDSYLNVSDSMANLKETLALFTEKYIIALKPYLEAELEEYNKQNKTNIAYFELLSNTELKPIFEELRKKATEKAAAHERAEKEKRLLDEQEAKAIKENLAILNDFLTDKETFKTYPVPKGSADFYSISTTRNGISNGLQRKFENLMLEFERDFSIEEQKIKLLIDISITNINFYKSSENDFIQLPLEETMRALGKTISTKTKKDFSKALREQILPSIAHAHLKVRIKDGSWLQMEIGGGNFGVDVKNNKIFMTVNKRYIQFVNSGSLSWVSNKTIHLGSKKDPLPFYISLILQRQYFNDCHRNNESNMTLSIKTLLSHTTDHLPTFEEVQEKDPGHWIRRIKEPIEKALNENEKIGLFKWEYQTKEHKKLKNKEVALINDYSLWENLYIFFDLIPEEPNQTERLEHKEKKIAANKEKKELAEAKEIIKADKIRKKNSNKGT